MNWLAPAGFAEFGVLAGDAAAQCEAGRQLNLLSQLKAGLAANSQEVSTDNDAVPAASAEPVAWTAVEPAVPHLAEPLSDGGSALAACWEQEVSQLRASSSAQPSGVLGMPWLHFIACWLATSPALGRALFLPFAWLLSLTHTFVLLHHLQPPL